MLSEDSMKLYIIIIKKWLPLDKTQALQFKNFGERNKRTFDDVIEIIIIMKNLSGLVLENPIQLDLLKEQFLKYQSMSEKDVSNDIWKSGRVYQKNTVTYDRMDITCF